MCLNYTASFDILSQRLTKYTIMKHIKITLFAVLLSASGVFAQKKQPAKAAQVPAVAIAIPTFNDTYSKYVKHIEQGNTGINYEEFRESYLASEQFKVASEKSQEYNRLKTLLIEQINKQKYTDVIKTAKLMLSIDYTSLPAQRALSIAYIENGDKKNAAKYSAVLKGLLESITTRGSGTSCASAWPVIQEEEEYFILESIGAGVVSVEPYRIDGGTCDQIATNTNGKSKTYYFETSRLEEGKKILTPVENTTGN